MIFSDENSLFIRKGLMPIMVRAIGLEESGIYLTIKSYEYYDSNGVDEMKILKSSSDGVEHNRKVLESLIRQGYVERTPDGVRTTNKRFEE